LAAGFAQALEELCEHSGLEAAAVCDPALPRTQRCFSEAVDKQAFASLLAAAPLRDKARLLSVSGRGAGSSLVKLDLVVCTMIRAMYDKVVRKILVNGQTTDDFCVHAGVPQGAVLSPVLYAIYIDGLHQACSNGRSSC
jgi:hypothetical protein